MGDLGAEEAGGRISIEGIGAGDGFLFVGPAVTVRIGCGIEGGEKCAGVVSLLPNVARAVFVFVNDGLGRKRGG